MLAGFVVAYDALQDYVPLKTLVLAAGPVSSIHMAVDQTGSVSQA